MNEKPAGDVSSGEQLPAVVWTIKWTKIYTWSLERSQLSSETQNKLHMQEGGRWRGTSGGAESWTVAQFDTGYKYTSAQEQGGRVRVTVSPRTNIIPLC